MLVRPKGAAMNTANYTRTGNLETCAAVLVVAAYLLLASYIRDLPLPAMIAVSLGLSGIGLLLSYWGIKYSGRRIKIIAYICFFILAYFTISFVIIALNH